jgi:peptidoglycan hydrolase-like protein with peptidoglycan-binding domain
LPRPRPVDAAALDSKPAEPKPADSLANLVKSAGAPPAPPSMVARPPAPIPASTRNEAPANPAIAARRVATVQRALTEYGYGQLKPTGTVGTDTQAAIQKFERERKMPVTGQMSDRLVRELAAVIGRPIE